MNTYGPEEQAMGLYYYLDNKIRFPFRAKCVASKTVSPLRKGETVEVRRMASEDVCAIEMFVMVHWQSRSLAVPLSQLTAIDPDDPTAEAIADWHYWVAQGYSLCSGRPASALRGFAERTPKDNQRPSNNDEPSRPESTSDLQHQPYSTTRG